MNNWERWTKVGVTPEIGENAERGMTSNSRLELSLLSPAAMRRDENLFTRANIGSISLGYSERDRVNSVQQRASYME